MFVAVVLWAWCAGRVRLVCVVVMIEGVNGGMPVVDVAGMWLCEGRREVCGCAGLWFAGCVAYVGLAATCVVW